MDSYCNEKVFNMSAIYLSRNETNGSTNLQNEKENPLDELPKNYIIVFYCGIFLILRSNLGSKKNENTTPRRIQQIRQILQILNAKLISITGLIVSALLFPIIVSILALFNLYRTTVWFSLRRKHGETFAGLLEGTDAVWAVEDVSKNIINVLAFVEIRDISKFIKELKSKMLNITHNEKFRKVNYLRGHHMGYYYWIKNKTNMDNNIREMKVIEGHADGLKDDAIKKLISESCNEELPENHHSSWEILVGKQPRMERKQSQFRTYPILFRIHHTVGDGLALMQLLLEILADKKPENNIPTCKNPKSNTTNLLTFIRLRLLFAVRHILLLIFAPGYLLQQILMRSVDKNILHGPELQGEKVATWIVEDERYPVLETVKKIRRNYPGASFTDVLLTALSSSLNKYFERNASKIPKSVTVVLPAQINDDSGNVSLEANKSECQLQNRFSVAMLNLPIHFVDNGSGKTRNMNDRLQEVKKETQIMKKAPDFQINYWLLRVVAKVLPKIFLRPVVQSAHSTLVMSSIPGPPKLSICGDHSIENLIFWLPNRGLTGIGVSILSYAEKLQIGIIADKILINHADEAEIILQEFVTSLKKMNDDYLEK